MKKTFVILFAVMILLTGCAGTAPARIAATTLPVYEFTAQICQETPLSVTRLVTEEVSCLHDYSLNVSQVKAAESAEVIVISGAGLEDFMADVLTTAPIIDASLGIGLITPEEHVHTHEEESHHDEGHHHEEDPHIWLSPVNAMTMAQNICSGLSHLYPDYQTVFQRNLQTLLSQLDDLRIYSETELKDLACREIITFHDGFAYLAQSCNLEILDAIEEESGSEASAKELIHMIREVEHHQLPAIFTEKSGSVSAAGIIARETGAKTYDLDMAMAGDSYFDAMYHNINTLKEALQ